MVPAMGSHGGATASGQILVLKELGISEESVGMPIRASMDTVLVGITPGGLPAYTDRIASEAGRHHIAKPGQGSYTVPGGL